MIDKRLRIIRDLERAIRIWEVARNDARQTVNETARAFITACNTSILAAKARIEELERED
jgi:hypothetical protein